MLQDGVRLVQAWSMQAHARDTSSGEGANFGEGASSGEGANSGEGASSGAR